MNFFWGLFVFFVVKKYHCHTAIRTYSCSHGRILNHSAAKPAALLGYSPVKGIELFEEDIAEGFPVMERECFQVG